MNAGHGHQDLLVGEEGPVEEAGHHGGEPDDDEDGAEVLLPVRLEGLHPAAVDQKAEEKPDETLSHVAEHDGEEEDEHDGDEGGRDRWCRTGGRCRKRPCARRSGRSVRAVRRRAPSPFPSAPRAAPPGRRTPARACPARSFPARRRPRRTSGAGSSRSPADAAGGGEALLHGVDRHGQIEIHQEGSNLVALGLPQDALSLLQPGKGLLRLRQVLLDGLDDVGRDARCVGRKLEGPGNRTSQARCPAPICPSGRRWP